MTSQEVVEQLKKRANPKNVEGMVRFGISSKNTLGVPVPELRKLGKEIGKNHKLAQELWEGGVHEARILASIVELPETLTEKQMDKWVKDFDSWDVCDQVCMNLFDKTPIAFKKAKQWAEDKREFVRRAGFALMASLAVHDKKAKDKDFIAFFPLIKKHSTDERNFVRKAVNWALRQIGKRNLSLNKASIKLVQEMKVLGEKQDNKTIRWIVNDALRELQSQAVQSRLCLKK